MSKWIAVFLVVLPLCGFSVAAEATYITLQGRPYVQATLTKVAENTYDFDYRWYFSDILPPGTWPQGGYDPVIGAYVDYYAWVPLALSSVAGDFGQPLDLSGHGIEESLNEYAALFSDGSFRVTQPPSGVLSFYGFDNIVTETWFRRPDGLHFGGRDIVGEITGTTHLFGAIPNSIGEQTAWDVIPEPPAWALGGLLLLGFATLRVRPRRPGPWPWCL